MMEKTTLTLLMLIYGTQGRDIILSETVMEVVEGQNLTIPCSFNPKLTLARNHLLWQRFSGGFVERISHMNETRKRNTRVEMDKKIGKYDLKITKATYTFHNGTYSCILLNWADNVDLYRRTQLKILAIPQKVTFTPENPVFTDGKSLEISCSSITKFPHCGIRVLLQKGEETRVLLSTTENCTAKIQYTPVKKDDGSTLTCQLYNDKLDLQYDVKDSLKVDVQSGVSEENSIKLVDEQPPPTTEVPQEVEHVGSRAEDAAEVIPHKSFGANEETSISILLNVSDGTKQTKQAQEKIEMRVFIPVFVISGVLIFVLIFLVLVVLRLFSEMKIIFNN